MLSHVSGSDSSSLEFSERWELVREIRGLSLFSPYLLSLVPESQLSCSTLSQRGRSKWGEGSCRCWGLQGGAEVESLPGCYFPEVLATPLPTLPEKQVGPSFPQSFLTSAGRAYAEQWVWPTHLIW